MSHWLYFYQHIPFHLSPTAFSIKGFSVDWYSLTYIIGFITVYLLLKYRIKKKENTFEFSFQKLLDFLFFAFAGLLLGGRLGYVFFYNFSYYFKNPLAIISPIDPVTHDFIGIYGMSYHGGLIGVVLFSWIFTKIYKVNFYKLANFIIPAVPAGYFFGRIGNFFNGELYGRVTSKPWGMYFSSDPVGILRHPSQVYEAILEGIVIFFFLWIIRNKINFQNKLLGIYLISYAVFRIIVEFFREPDPQIGYIFSFLTLGQILSLLMMLLGVLLVVYSKKNKKVLK